MFKKIKNIVSLPCAFLLTILFASCSDFEVPAPERMQTSTHIPSTGSPSQIVIPIKADLSKTIDELKTSFDNPVVKKSELIQIPTKLHIEYYVLGTVKKEIEKQDVIIEDETRRECERSEERCTETEKTLKRVVRKATGPGELVEFVEKTICVASGPVCVAWKNVWVGTKVVQVPVKMIVDVQEPVLKIVDKVMKIDSELDYTAIVADSNVEIKDNTLSAWFEVDYKIKINSKLKSPLGGQLSEKLKQVDVKGSTSCGIDEPLRRIRLNLKGSLETKNDSSLELSNTSWSINWVNACELTAFDIELSNILDLPNIKKIVKSVVEKAINKLPKSKDLSDKVETVLKGINKPHSLGDKLWLVPRVESVEISPITGAGKNLSTTLFIQARPAVEFADISSQPQPSTQQPVLKVGTHEPKVEINLVSKVSFDKAKEVLLDKLKKYDDLPFTVTLIDVYGSHEKLVLGVKISKPVNGVIYFVGTPKYEPKINAITFPDLDYTAETKNIMAKIPDVALPEKIVTELRKQSVFYLDNNTYKAFYELSHKVIPIGDLGEVILNAKEIGFSEAWVSPDGIFASIFLHGNSEAHISK
jgi:hypothetical protein